MGFKRPFDCEDLHELPFKQARQVHELPFKQARQVDYSNKMTQFANLYRTTSQGTDVTDDHEGSFAKTQQHQAFENKSIFEASNLVDNFGINDPWSAITTNFNGDDFGSRLAPHSSDFLETCELDSLQRSEASEDTCSSSLDSSPRKPIPLGPNHQASIPVWDGHVNKKQLGQKDSLRPISSLLLESNFNIYNDDEEKLMGTCIIPMPDIESSGYNSNEVGVGKKDCSCMDEGSVRCVQQHIMEARERLRRSLGHEKLVDLGFYEMGEEVTNKWTKEEERVFHAVVNSNPASLGQNFWKHLSHVFPTRSTNEIVSYYFNVFMLRRRAAQNRSHLLDIDSDDDELHGINRGSYRARIVDEDYDSDNESIDQYDHEDHGEDTLVENDDEDDDDDDGSDGDGELGYNSGEATGEDSGVDNASEAHDMKPFNGSKVDSSKHFNKYTESVQDDSCMSFEFQADSVETEGALGGSQVKSNQTECFPGSVDGYSDGVDQLYLLDSCDAKAWDTRYSAPIKGVDLLPTCNIIEEIFGLGTSCDK
ncbi:uncharacterized protein LOC126688175 [Mercurialis annua]|uniref:uncharacterized protein LOC126688175 n=1 Tax=Mercurialis annua TaxID=3986 RepID=UPI00215F39CD|nr:uncharacterized protein LOC126688175 [Mercurialis annua]